MTDALRALRPSRISYDFSLNFRLHQITMLAAFDRLHNVEKERTRRFGCRIPRVANRLARIHPDLRVATLNAHHKAIHFAPDDKPSRPKLRLDVAPLHDAARSEIARYSVDRPTPIARATDVTDASGSDRSRFAATSFDLLILERGPN